MLTKQETYELIDRYQKYNDQEAFNTLYNENKGLIYASMKNFLNKPDNALIKEDLEAEGKAAFFLAIKKFDLNYDCAFSTYIVPMIQGKVINYLRDKKNLIKLNRDFNNIRIKIKKYEEEFENMNRGEKPNIEMVHKATGIKMADILRCKSNIANMISLDNVLYDESDDNKRITFSDLLKYTDSNLEYLTEKDALKEIFNGLDNREKIIFTQRFIYGKTQSEISKMLKVTQTHISRLEKKLQKKVQNELAKSGIYN